MRFNINSPFMDFMTTTVQFIALNIIFLLCCLPVITIGPAVAALYQVIMRETRGEHGYLIRKFFRHMKEMFVQALLTFLLLAAVILLLIFNLAFWNAMEGILAGIIVVLLILLLVIMIIITIYVFPLMARFQNSFRRTLRNAFYIALTNRRTTVFLLLIHLIAAGILYIFPPGKVFMLLIGFSFIAYCNSYLLGKVFKQYEPDSETGIS